MFNSNRSNIWCWDSPWYVYSQPNRNKYKKANKIMDGIVILISVIVGTMLLGRYAIREGHRIERQKKFMKNMENFDKKKR